nr:hypothetical protein [Streptomyces sp. SM13]
MPARTWNASGLTTSTGYAGRAAGTSSYTTVKKVKSTSTGALKTTVKAGKSGTWRWTYFGNTTSGAKSSTGDRVEVR